jgi:DNA repair exonuclease SbcCD ATPase subunit
MTQHIATTTLSLSYPFTPDKLSEALVSLRGHSFTTPAQYKDGVKAIATCREFRVQIEERRKLLKEDSLKYGREVDRIAKQLTELVLEVEGPLKLDRKKVDDAKELAKREAAEAVRRKQEEEIRAKREAEEAELKAKRQAEEQALAAERRALEAEKLQLAKERQETEARQAEERRELEALRAEAKATREALEREARVQREAQARAQAEARAVAEAEEQRLNALEYEKQRQRRIAALQPDQDKLNQLARNLQTLIDDHGEAGYEYDDQGAHNCELNALGTLAEVVESLTSWKARQQ